MERDINYFPIVTLADSIPFSTNIYESSKGSKLHIIDTIRIIVIIVIAISIPIRIVILLFFIFNKNISIKNIQIQIKELLT